MTDENIKIVLGEEAEPISFTLGSESDPITFNIEKADLTRFTELFDTPSVITDNKFLKGSSGSLIETDITESDIIDLKDYALNSALTSHIEDTTNPHSVTKTQVGLGNVDDTSDLNKPISTATQSALDLKLDISNYTDPTAHIADTTIHFTQEQISITESQISDLKTYALNSDLTTHTGDSTIHFDQGDISIPASQISDFDTEVSNNTDVAANTNARHTHSNKALLDTYTQSEADLADAVSKKHDAVTVTDSSEIDFTLTGQDITASIIAGSVDVLKLDAGVQTSLGKADSALQVEADPVFTASQAFNIDATDITNLSNLSGTNTGDQVGDGTTITGTGTIADPFVAVGGGDTYNTSWTKLATQWTAEPVSVAYSGGDGEVLEYTYGITKYYRFIPSTYDSNEDKFYSTYSNPTLSGLIATRGVTI